MCFSSTLCLVLHWYRLLHCWFWNLKKCITLYLCFNVTCTRLMCLNLWVLEWFIKLFSFSAEYVQLYAGFLLNKSIYKQFAAFYRGFHSVCASDALMVSRDFSKLSVGVGLRSARFPGSWRVTISYYNKLFTSLWSEPPDESSNTGFIVRGG